MKIYLGTFAVLLLVLSAGCMKNHYVHQGNAEMEPSYNGDFQHHLLFGIVPLSDAIDVAATCPSGVAKIETGTSFLNGLVGALSQNIYTPRYAKVYCNDGTSHRFDWTPEQQVSDAR